MKAKRKRRLTKIEREIVRERDLAEQRALGYHKGIADGHKSEAQSYEGRRFSMAESLVIAAVAVACGQRGDAAQIVDALAHMMPYRNNGNQRP